MRDYSIETARREIAEHFGEGVTGTDPQFILAKGANDTTNYRKDKHENFCKRCYKHNEGCINTGTKRKDPECRV